MRLISWNVNGLRAAVKKGFMDSFNALDADIFCLQETKLQAGQIELDLPGYHQYWCYAEKKGYSGTAVFSRVEPISVTYNLGYPEPEPYWFWGHRIEAVNIDLMNALPLPERHPQDLWTLAPGESRQWRLYGVAFDGDGIGSDNVGETFEETMSRVAGIPMIRIARTSYSPGETAVWESVIDGKTEMHKTVLGGPGLYPMEVTSEGRTATAMLGVHPSWEWSLRKARENVLTSRQKATSHVESWYGFHSGFLAARYFPDDSLDQAVNARFGHLMNLLYGPDMSEPKYYAWRIQNTASTIGMFTDRFEAFGNVEDLETAERLADWMIRFSQAENGAYMNGRTVYTSVIYVAKSVLELAMAEKSYAQSLSGAAEGPYRYCPEDDSGDRINCPEDSLVRKHCPEDILRWKKSAYRHFGSAKKAIDQLVRAQGDFHTEGEITFEDGMVSCSALQMGQIAVLLDDFTGTDADGFAWNIDSRAEADSLRRLYTGEMLSLQMVSRGISTAVPRRILSEGCIPGKCFRFLLAMTA